MENFLLENLWIVILIIAWSIPWKGIALWRSARNEHLAWFVALLFINSMAILDIIYILIFSRSKREISENPDMKIKNNQDLMRKNKFV